jgi:hypothetical protein
MRTRPRYLAVLVLALAGLVTYLVVPAAIGREHRAAESRAAAIAAALPDADGAILRPPRDCVLAALRCSHVDRDTDVVVAEVASALRRVSGTEPRLECSTQWTTRSVRLRECIVAAETGRGHGVFVFVDTATHRDGNDLVADGTQVGLTVD